MPENQALGGVESHSNPSGWPIRHFDREVPGAAGWRKMPLIRPLTTGDKSRTVWASFVPHGSGQYVGRLPRRCLSDWGNDRRSLP